MEIVEVIKPKENEHISKIENLDENSLNKEKEENESKNKPKNDSFRFMKISTTFRK